jgi:peptidoglycan/LPS O-acetylase OafA/YrhL
MGYQPGLDGLRAVSVIVIMLYHGGFAWIHGGFFSVEVFFATSGFLITTLLLEERERSGRVAFRQFWMRRARRLLPALAVLLATVAVVTLLAGTDDQLSTLRRDLPWSIFYASNWGQILGDIPYWAADPPLLRHLWTLAIEEQFYLLWPLAFVALGRVRRGVAVRVLLGLTAACMALAFWIHAAGPGPMGGAFDGADRVNFNYLSTGTRAGALLLGSAAAYVWQPWRTASRLRPAVRRRVGRLLDRSGGLLIGLFGCVAATAVITEGYVYQWLLAVMTVVATALVLIVVHPAATGMQRIFGWRPLVEIGKRSYGLYLWHWPVFVFAGAIHGEVAPFLVSIVIAAALSEICYRYVETPVRQGAFGRW